MQEYIESGAFTQLHVHGVQGSVKLADYVCVAHTHRMTTVSGPPIEMGERDHVHEICFGTDSFEGHVHGFTGQTGGAICTGCGHVHYLEGMVTCAENHRHCFKLTTLIDDPIAE